MKLVCSSSHTTSANWSVPPVTSASDENSCFTPLKIRIVEGGTSWNKEQVRIQSDMWEFLQLHVINAFGKLPALGHVNASTRLVSCVTWLPTQRKNWFISNS